MEILLGGLIFATGFFTCYFTRKTQKENKQETYVKRIKPSLRNPLKTYEVSYEKYKSKDNNLMEPVRPKKRHTISEVET
jgi:hypothetical protein